MKINVVSRTSRIGGYEPCVFHLGTRRLPVAAVLERWQMPEHAFFRVRVDDGRRFVLRHCPASGAWELASVYGPD